MLAGTGAVQQRTERIPGREVRLPITGDGAGVPADGPDFSVTSWSARCGDFSPASAGAAWVVR